MSSQGQSTSHHLSVFEERFSEPNAVEKDQNIFPSTCVAVGELQTSSFQYNPF